MIVISIILKKEMSSFVCNLTQKEVRLLFFSISINKYADGLYFASKYSSISIVTELLVPTVDK